MFEIRVFETSRLNFHDATVTAKLYIQPYGFMLICFNSVMAHKSWYLFMSSIEKEPLENVTLLSHATKSEGIRKKIEEIY